MNEFLCIFPLLFLVLGGLGLMLADAFFSRKGDVGELSALLLLFVASFEAVIIGTDTPISGALLAPYLATDTLSLLGDIVICISGALALLIASKHLREQGIERGEFYILMVFTTFGAMVLARASSTLTVFLGLETMSLGIYSLVAFRRTDKAAAEAAIKYFLLGSFAAAVLLFGSALLYTSTGHLDFKGIRDALPSGGLDIRIMILGMVLTLIGLTFKVSAVPFHAWTPDAYEGAPTPTTAYMSVVVKVAAFFVFARMFIVCFGDPVSAEPRTGWPMVLAVLSVLSMGLGNVAALLQTKIKRLLAYSSIGHAGYLLIGLAVSHATRTEGTSAMVFYLLGYAAATLAVFGSLVLLSTKGKEVLTLADLNGLGRKYPLATLPLLLGTFSLMGMPPTAGFFGKYYVFLAAVEAGQPLMWLALVGVATSAIGLLYYLRIVVALYMKQSPQGVEAGTEESLAKAGAPRFSMQLGFTLIITVYFVLKMGITPSNYLELARRAAEQLG